MTNTSHVAPDSAVDPLVLAIDAGTSSTRAIVYDGRGRLVDGWEVHRPYSVDTTADGGVTLDPECLFDLTASCIDSILTMVNSGQQKIQAVSCDTFWHSLMGVDSRGTALTPVFTWADTRSKSAVPKLRRLLDERDVHQRTGTMLHSSYLPAKLLWLRETDRALTARVKFWMSFAEYLYYRLFGERRVSISMASGTGLFEQRACVWDSKILDALEVRAEQLSPISDFDDVLTALRQPLAERWPALKQVPWYLPLGDGACNNIGSGGFCPEWPVIMVGTSGAMRAVHESDTVEVPFGLWSYRVDRRRLVQGGALSEGGNIFSWLTHTLQLAAISQLEADLSRATPDGHGLTILPFLAGERSPNWSPHARAAFVGMTLDTRAIDIVQASLEAVAYQFAAVHRLLQHVVCQPEGIIASGAGLIHSPALMQLMSDVLDQPVSASAVSEATSRGAALLVIEQLAGVSRLSDFETPLGATYQPRRDACLVYEVAMKRQETLYDLLVRGQGEDQNGRAAFTDHGIDASEPRASEAARHYRHRSEASQIPGSRGSE